MRIAREEIFGPVGYHSFDTEEEAIAIANDTNYGWQPVVDPRCITGAPRRL